MISLTDLLKVPSLSELKIIGGESGAGNEINTVTLLDAPDGPKWLKGGEFVLTSAYIFDNDYTLLETYIRSLIEHQASGLGIKTGRFLGGVPDHIVRLADENRFPLVQIPYKLVWTDVIAPFYKLKYNLYDFVKPIIIEPAMILPLFEAGKWGGKQLLLHLTELVHRPIAVYRQDKSLILNNGIYGIHQIEAAVAGLKILPELWHPQRVIVNDFICSIFCLPMSYENEREYLVLASEREEDIEELEKLMDLLESLSGKAVLSLREKSDAYRILLHKLISFTVTAEELAAFEENRSAGKKAVVYSGIMILSGPDPMQLYRNLKDALAVYREDQEVKIDTYAFEYQARQQAVVIWEVHSELLWPPTVWLRSLMPLLETTSAAAEHNRIAVSGMSEVMKDLPCLYEQARDALYYGGVLWPDQSCYFYPDYSMYVLLKEQDLEQIDFADCLLLCENKSTAAFQPLETAEAYLESGNYKKAAAKLFIHENTLRYRINKINELLHINLEKPVEAHRFLQKIKLWKLKHAAEGN